MQNSPAKSLLFKERHLLLQQQVEQAPFENLRQHLDLLVSSELQGNYKSVLHHLHRFGEFFSHEESWWQWAIEFVGRVEPKMAGEKDYYEFFKLFFHERFIILKLQQDSCTTKEGNVLLYAYKQALDKFIEQNHLKSEYARRLFVHAAELHYNNVTRIEQAVQILTQSYSGQAPPSHDKRLRLLQFERQSYTLKALHHLLLKYPLSFTLPSIHVSDESSLRQLIQKHDTDAISDLNTFQQLPLLLRISRWHFKEQEFSLLHKWLASIFSMDDIYYNDLKHISLFHIEVFFIHCLSSVSFEHSSIRATAMSFYDPPSLSPAQWSAWESIYYYCSPLQTPKPTTILQPYELAQLLDSPPIDPSLMVELGETSSTYSDSEDIPYNLAVIALLQKANDWFHNNPGAISRISEASFAIIATFIKRADFEIARIILSKFPESVRKNVFLIILAASHHDTENAFFLMEKAASLLSSPTPMQDLLKQIQTENSSLGGHISDIQFQELREHAQAPPPSSPVKPTKEKMKEFYLPTSNLKEIKPPPVLTTEVRRLEAKHKLQELRAKLDQLMGPHQPVILFESEETEDWFTSYYDFLEKKRYQVDP